MRTLGRLIVAVLIVVVLIVGVPWLVVAGLVAGRSYTEAADVPERSVALVMGAATWNGRPSPYLEGRLNSALELWRAGKVQVLIVSGSTADNEPAVMRDYLVEHGVEEADIVLDNGGNSSYSSCIRAKEHFGVDALTVVTQNYHVPRTVATCRMVGIDAVGLGDVQPTTSTLWRYRWRELGANIKMFADVLTRRDAGQGTYSPAVDEALERHR